MSEERSKIMDTLIAQDADLIDKLRNEDSYYRIQEKHWCIDAEELERQRLAAANRIAEQAAEVERLRKLIEATSAHFLRLNVDHPIMWEGAIDAAMEAVCLEVERQAAELAKWKALAETLAGALGPFAAEWDKREFLAECHWSAYSGASQSLTSYKEQRDA